MKIITGDNQLIVVNTFITSIGVPNDAPHRCEILLESDEIGDNRRFNEIAGGYKHDSVMLFDADEGEIDLVIQRMKEQFLAGDVIDFTKISDELHKLEST